MWALINHVISPKKFFHLSTALLPWLMGLCVLALGYGITGGLLLAPADYLQGDGFRIIYVHAPCAFLSILIYAVMTGAAIATLVFQLTLAPMVIRHSAPIGAMFTFLALVTGSLWGKPMWGTWWIWDARLTSELILLFIYLGLLLFQSAVSTKRSADRSIAILILIGAVDLPIIHYSVYWWNTLHQGATLNIFSPSAIDQSMLYPLLSMIAGFILYYGIVLCLRINYELTAVNKNPRWLRKDK